MNILLTAGATREYLDAVRFFTNVSTGSTGAQLADALAAHGHAVTLLRGEAAAAPATLPDSALHTFSSCENLQSQLRAHLATGAFDAVIQCAAISDYRPAETLPGKLSSYAPELTLRLVPTPKLLPALKATAPAGRVPLVIGFKLTATTDSAERLLAVSKLFVSGTVDAVIHNDAGDLGSGNQRPFRAYVAAHLPPVTLAGTAALAEWLHTFISGSTLAPAPRIS